MDSCNDNSAQMLTADFMIALDNQLNNRISYLTASNAEYEARIRAMKQDMAHTYKRIKTLKEKKCDYEKYLTSLENNLTSLKLYKTSQNDHLTVLMAKLDGYKKETDDLAKGYRETLEQYGDKWTSYKMHFEEFPLAVAKKNAEIELLNATIQLNVQRYKLVELRTIVEQRKAIEKRRNHILLVQCAEYWKECEILKKDLERATNTKKNRQRELHRKETMLITLMTEKQMHLSSAAANQSQHNSSLTVKSLQRFNLPRLSLPNYNARLSLNMQHTVKDFSDTSSICSSFLEELVGPLELSPKNVSKSPEVTRSSTISKKTDEVHFAKPNYPPKTSTNEVASAAIQRNENVASQNLSESPQVNPSKRASSTDRELEKEKKRRVVTIGETTEIAYCEEVDAERVFPNSNEEPRAIQTRGSSEMPVIVPESQHRIPRIKSIQQVQIDVPTKTQQSPQKFFPGYYPTSSPISESGWAKKNSENLLNVESAKETGSVVDSEISDDALKQYCVTFSPEGSPVAGSSYSASSRDDHRLKRLSTNVDNNQSNPRSEMRFANFNDFNLTTGKKTKTDVDFFSMF